MLINDIHYLISTISDVSTMLTFSFQYFQQVWIKILILSNLKIFKYIFSWCKNPGPPLWAVYLQADVSCLLSPFSKSTGTKSAIPDVNHNTHQNTLTWYI